MGTPETISVLVDDARMESWPLSLVTIAAHRRYRLTMTSPDGESWSAESGDVFACLLDPRVQVEPRGLRICCNGSRRDAWASGMQRDMGQGLFVYRLGEVARGQAPPQVNTLDPAPSSEIVTVAEQRAWYENWPSSATAARGARCRGQQA